MSEFRPTYLYIKQHSVTGKLYFGKTIQDPIKYKGSGKHWMRHTKVHGRGLVETLWYCLYTEEEELIKFALMFSEQEEIVSDNSWLNLKPENGKDGWVFGSKQTQEHCINQSIRNMGNKYSLGSKRTPEFRERQSIRMIGKKLWLGRRHTIEFCKRQSIRQTGKPHPLQKVICPYCKLEGAVNNMKRYHFENCKNK